MAGRLNIISRTLSDRRQLPAAYPPFLHPATESTLPQSSVLTLAGLAFHDDYRINRNRDHRGGHRQ